MKYLTGLVIAALLFSLVGCGKSEEGVPTSLPRGEKTRPMTVGDKMDYDVFIGMTDSKGKSVGSASGTVTVEVRKAAKHVPVPSNIKKTYHIAERMELGQTASGQISWMGQDSEGAIYLLGRLDQGADWVFVKEKSPKPDVPASLAEGESWGYTARLSDGKTQKDSYKIVGIEKVETDAGELEAYKTEIGTKMSDGRHAKGFIWLRPDLPRPVKFRLDLTYPDPKKPTTNIEQVLTKYKLAE